MAQFGDSGSSRVIGLPNMRTLRDQRAAAQGRHGRVRVTEDSEMALLAQFMRHDSVASLASAIGKRAGVRGEDLITAAGLGPRCARS